MTLSSRAGNMTMMEWETEHPSTNMDTTEPSGPAASAPLPMVVWLRGDEDHCGDFSLDAEAVMESLGIRRTRLTQISGRELRVGRIRRGRYIVPVYRPVDVMEYQQWTRAPATHIKSSTLVHEAADSLRQAGEELASRFDDSLTQLGSCLDQTVRQGSLATTSLTLPLLQDLARKASDLGIHLEWIDRYLRSSASSIDEKLGAHGRETDILRTMLSALTRDITELMGLTRLAIDEGRSHHQELTALIQHLGQEIEDKIKAASQTPSPMVSHPTRKARSQAHGRRMRHNCEERSGGKPPLPAFIRRRFK